ncbi:hypothetical protein PtA15_1A588 [Puccinia triticina]|uniref:SCP2 domain-containing protein n=1 Tax=Puccinia triticina TaxID=208348 RepID=A0ABY7C7V3_9BASI|nr:uncharacterized protein PtA15_1A588 [Puccinia triticina]WAQ81248.1 hypothetical protein PtA15_1A588 [Puccinia triticina]
MDLSVSVTALIALRWGPPTHNSEFFENALARPLLEGLPDHDATIPLNLDSNSQARGSEGNSFSLGPDASPSPNFQEKLSNRKRLLGQDQQHAGQTSPHLSTMERDKGSDGKQNNILQEEKLGSNAGKRKKNQEGTMDHLNPTVRLGGSSPTELEQWFLTAWQSKHAASFTVPMDPTLQMSAVFIQASWARVPGLGGLDSQAEAYQQPSIKPLTFDQSSHSFSPARTNTPYFPGLGSSSGDSAASSASWPSDSEDYHVPQGSQALEQRLARPVKVLGSSVNHNSAPMDDFTWPSFLPSRAHGHHVDQAHLMPQLLDLNVEYHEERHSPIIELDSEAPTPRDAESEDFHEHGSNNDNLRLSVDYENVTEEIQNNGHHPRSKSLVPVLRPAEHTEEAHPQMLHLTSESSNPSRSEKVFEHVPDPHVLVVDNIRHSENEMNAATGQAERPVTQAKQNENYIMEHSGFSMGFLKELKEQLELTSYPKNSMSPPFLQQFTEKFGTEIRKQFDDHKVTIYDRVQVNGFPAVIFSPFHKNSSRPSIIRVINQTFRSGSRTKVPRGLCHMFNQLIAWIIFINTAMLRMENIAGANLEAEKTSHVRLTNWLWEEVFHPPGGGYPVMGVVTENKHLVAHRAVPKNKVIMVTVPVTQSEMSTTKCEPFLMDKLVMFGDSITQFAWQAGGTGAELAQIAPFKPDVTIWCSDNNLVALATGEMNPQKLYTANQIKVRGNLDKALKVEQIISHKREQNRSYFCSSQPLSI